MKNKMFDVIGDVHGDAKSLIFLLSKLGYSLNNNIYSHPDNRFVVFIGDYIDRGDEEELVLDIIINMVNSGNAKALMGNHEYNAICYATSVDGVYIRKHSEQNNRQHSKFLKEYPFGTKKHTEVINFFKTLPLFLEIDNVRFVHASWQSNDINHLKCVLNPDNTIPEILYRGLIDNNCQDYKSIETILKGVEVEYPDDFYWTDHHGTKRTSVRLNWFNNIENPTYKNTGLSIPKHVVVPDNKIVMHDFIYKDEIIVFFGHYWMTGLPLKQNDFCACVDYLGSSDVGIVAYRYNGEKTIKNENFVF